MNSKKSIAVAQSAVSLAVNIVEPVPANSAFVDRGLIWVSIVMLF